MPLLSTLEFISGLSPRRPRPYANAAAGLLGLLALLAMAACPVRSPLPPWGVACSPPGRRADLLFLGTRSDRWCPLHSRRRRPGVYADQSALSSGGVGPAQLDFLEHPGEPLSCLDFDSTRERMARKRMRVQEGAAWRGLEAWATAGYRCR